MKNYIILSFIGTAFFLFAVGQSNQNIADKIISVYWSTTKDAKI